jgi:endonuclease YncB( thermonuclease family)
MVDLGVEDLFKRVRVRLAGVDTPPYQGRAAEGAAGEVRRWVRDMTRGKDILLLVHSRLSNSWVCTVIVDHSGDNPIDLNAELVAKGYVYSKGNK